MSKYDTAWLNEETGEIHTPKGQMAWPNLLVAKSIKGKDDSKPSFSVTLLLPKASIIDLLKSMLVEALVQKFGAEWKKKKGLNYPLLKTVDQEALQQYAEAFPFILRCKANEDYPPFIYNSDATRFDGKPSDIYAGRWAVGAGKFYAYDNVSKGVNFGLNRIQLLDHDEPIAGGRVATASGFEKFDSGAGKTTDSAFGEGTKAAKGGAFEDDEIPF